MTGTLEIWHLLLGLVALLVTSGGFLFGFYSLLRSDIRSVQDGLAGVRERLARIEGHLFGAAPDTTHSQD